MVLFRFEKAERLYCGSSSDFFAFWAYKQPCMLSFGISVFLFLFVPESTSEAKRFVNAGI